MQKNTLIWILVLIAFIGGGLLYRQMAQEVDSRGATRLMRALEEKDTNKTRQLLESAPDIHARDKSGHTALFYAARYTQDPLVLHKLVAAGADTLTTDKHGYTPLMLAAQYNSSPRIIMALARYGRFLEQQTDNKNKALALAAQHNTAPVIKILLKAGADPVTSSGENAARFLAENPQLTDQEKTDLRQIMLLLEILEAREKFQREISHRSPISPQSGHYIPASKPLTVKPPQADSSFTIGDTPALKKMDEEIKEESSSTVQPLLGTPTANPLVNLNEKKAEETELVTQNK